MSDPNPQEGITPGGKPPPPPKGGIAPGAPPKPAPPAKKPYEKYDDDVDQTMPSLSKPGPGDGPGLNSLAQAARGKHLGQIRWTLIIIGVLTIGANAVVLWITRGNVEDELRRQGINQIPPHIESLLFLSQCITAMFIALGAVFVTLGIFVKAHPVPCTIAGLVLYLVGFAISVAMSPETIAQGIILKVIIVVALAKAIGSARAYEAEKSQLGPAD
jgi:hypothetical protein